MQEPPDIIPGTDLHPGNASVAALRQALESGALTSAGLTSFYLGRIQRLDPDVHSVLAVSPDAAEQARASDEARAAGRSRGPLEGIPVLVKDNIQVAGMPATAGSPALLETESGDAFCVSRLRESGAVIIGKANLSEWANFRSTHSTSGWSTLGGQVANPRGPGRNPSGSSSGSGAAIAAGIVPLAIGTETDGSIVCPSSACGIVGIKPTTGLVSRSGIVPVSLAQDTAGPMAASVADAAALLSVLAGDDPADPAVRETAATERAHQDYPAYLESGALAGARLGVWRAVSEEANATINAVLDSAVALLREAGATVLDPVELPGTDDIGEPEYTALLHEFKRDLNAYLASLTGGQHPVTLTEVIEFNRRNADRVMARFGQEIFEQADACSGDPADPELAAAREAAISLARTSLDQPLIEGELDAIIALTVNPACLTDYILGDYRVFNSTMPAAAAGYPTVTVPAGAVSGLPVGLSFIGPAWSEPRLIALAYAFEQGTLAR
jgi:amidase